MTVALQQAVDRSGKRDDTLSGAHPYRICNDPLVSAKLPFNGFGNRRIRNELLRRTH